MKFIFNSIEKILNNTKNTTEAFIGILYLRAGFKGNLLNRELIWYHESSHDVITAKMSKNRFKFVNRFVTFDDKPTSADRWKTDKFVCIGELFESINEKNVKMRYPSLLLAIDEILNHYRGCIGFK